MSIPAIILLTAAALCAVAALVKKQFVIAAAMLCFIISGVITHFPHVIPLPVWASLAFMILFFVLICAAGILNITRNIPK